LNSNSGTLTLQAGQHNDWRLADGCDQAVQGLRGAEHRRHHLAGARLGERLIRETKKPLISVDRRKLEFTAENDNRIRALGNW
jgi:hypothetical protein